MEYLKGINLKGKTIKFPIYFPDATRAVVRSLDSNDLQKAGIEGVVVNTYHLMSQPGATVIKQAGGIKKFMNWPGFVASDSGGFQILSLIQRNSSAGSITDKGIIFRSGSKKTIFSPEKSIQVQFALDPDIIVCLDDFTPPRAKLEEIEISVNRTVEWAKRCKEEFIKHVEREKLSVENRPLLLGVIQGGDDKLMRERCAKELLKIGFDGYGFGGWPLDKNGKLNFEITSFTASLTPDDIPRFALGVGNPQNILDCFRCGYHIFDCVLPTRDARHRRLYVFSRNPDEPDFLETEQVHDYLYILKAKYNGDKRAISEHCDCFTCQNYTRAYLHHLFRIQDALAWRLATIHNLRMYTRLTEKLRGYIK
ncbi:tRNA guanosine(34) transglycosylase Tgt [Patescibacteria group bacterium]|nr:tRNA guanosine(34) transglycosylase Tgt [Patescibacteria group bacterium]